VKGLVTHRPAHAVTPRRTWRVILLLTCGGTVAAISTLGILVAGAELHYVYFNRDNLPDLGPFIHGQHGFARAAEYYSGRPLTTFTENDADKAATLAGIAKAPRDYAPSVQATDIVVRRRNQTLSLMLAHGSLSPEATARATARTLHVVRPPPAGCFNRRPSWHMSSRNSGR
jgi:hypothetical protein